MIEKPQRNKKSATLLAFSILFLDFTRFLKFYFSICCLLLSNSHINLIIFFVHVLLFQRLIIYVHRKNAPNVQWIRLEAVVYWSSSSRFFSCVLFDMHTYFYLSLSFSFFDDYSIHSNKWRAFNHLILKKNDQILKWATLFVRDVVYLFTMFLGRLWCIIEI